MKNYGRLLTGSLVFAFMILMVGCRQYNKTLTLNQLKEVMWDLSKAEAFQTYYLNRDTAINFKDEGNKNYAKIFALHGVKASDFFYSLKAYRSNPDKFKLLLDSVHAYGTRIRENSIADTTTLSNPSNN